MERRKINILFIIFFPLHIYSFFEPSQISFSSKNIAIIGTGYVGLISGAGLAEIGHQVICVDIDLGKINNLNQGIMPIYEEGLQELIQKHKEKGTITFTVDFKNALISSDIVIIAVGTPIGDDGAANMSAFHAVINSLAQQNTGHKIVCIKSTVPVGTNKQTTAFFETIKKKLLSSGTFDVVSNPEFLREGCALKDFFGRNPIIVGGESNQAVQEILQMYQPLIKGGQPLIVTDPVTAETIKYAWNTYLKVRISYINDMARFCCSVGADIDGILQGLIISDQHLPTEKLSPGPGIGGSCFPKDALALISLAHARDVQLPMIEATVTANKVHKAWVVEQVYELLGNQVKGKTVAVLGAAFKANTDDIRYSPALEALGRLLPDGARVQVYDPKAMHNMEVLFPQAVYCKTMNDAVDSADVIVLLTEWPEFKEVDIGDIAKRVRQKNIVDARNLWDPVELKKYGFTVRNLARKSRRA